MEIVCVVATYPRNGYWNDYVLNTQYNIEIEKKEAVPALDSTVKFTNTPSISAGMHDSDIQMTMHRSQFSGSVIHIIYPPYRIVTRGWYFVATSPR